MNKVEYRTFSGQWKPLDIMGVNFYDMEKAIEFVRSNMQYHKMAASVELRLLDNGVHFYWDNF